MSAGTGAITDVDIDEFTHVYAQGDGFAGASGLYRLMRTEGESIQQIVARGKLTMPVLSIAAGTGPFTHQTMNAVAENVTQADLAGFGHHAALEDPAALAQTVNNFYRSLDN
jgi:hypothetical protein